MQGKQTRVTNAFARSVERVRAVKGTRLGEVPNITIHLQPSVTKHKTFTDFLFVYENGVIKGFIEVKKEGCQQI